MIPTIYRYMIVYNAIAVEILSELATAAADE
jgi:hypothetical protein